MPSWAGSGPAPPSLPSRWGVGNSLGGGGWMYMGESRWVWMGELVGCELGWGV